MAFIFEEEFIISCLERTQVPKVYLLEAKSKDEQIIMRFDLPFKLQELMNFKEGEKLNVLISNNEINDITDSDLYMNGIVLSKNKNEVFISIGGLMLKFEGKNIENLSNLTENEKLFIRIRKE